ncbi:MAG: sigma-70 family RNA polymerase sigma factor [Bacteroidota bacterium]
MKEGINIQSWLSTYESGATLDKNHHNQLLMLLDMAFDTYWKEELSESQKQFIFDQWINDVLPAWSKRMSKEANEHSVWLVESLDQQSLLFCLKGKESLRKKGMLWLYHSHYESILLFLKSKISSNQWEDLASKTMILFVEAVLDQKYTGQSPVGAYLHGIARNLLRKYFRSQDVQQRHEETVIAQHQSPIDPETDFILSERKQFVHRLLYKLDQKCRQLLQKWILKYSMAEIAQEMGFKNEAVARNTKRRCFTKLMQYIAQDPSLNQSLKEWK